MNLTIGNVNNSDSSYEYLNSKYIPKYFAGKLKSWVELPSNFYPHVKEHMGSAISFSKIYKSCSIYYLELHWVCFHHVITCSITEDCNFL